MNKTSCLVVAALMLALSPHSFARDTTGDFESVTADVVLARPLWLVATVIGTGLFVVTLPVAAMSKSVNKTGRTLVVKPAQATFTRPLGDFSDVE
jgi:hypothetical protein